jgi:hypothetical protein
VTAPSPGHGRPEPGPGEPHRGREVAESLGADPDPLTLLERHRADERAPGASCLLYLFADGLVPRQSLGGRLLHQVSVPTPGTGTPVALRPLEDHLLAVAVYDLWINGVIDCDFRGEPEEPSWGWIERGTDGPTPPLGVEGHLVDLLPEEPVSLWELVTDRWRPEGWDHLPLNALVIDAQLEAAELRITGPPATPDLTTAGYYHFPPVTVDEGRLGRLEQALDRTEVAWRTALLDGSLRPLLTHCHRVINGARPHGPLSPGS